ncbi:unnamed protein product, partial [Polarella glacialis]
VSTKAFVEAQEVSNCQHFVTESLAELASRGHLSNSSVAEGTDLNLTMRNQAVADTLRGWGYLDADCKAAPPAGDGGPQLWRLLLSWRCKAGVALWASSWAESFTLRPASLT